MATRLSDPSSAPPSHARMAPILHTPVAPRFRPLRAHPRFQRVLATIWPDDFAAESSRASRAGL